MVNLLNKGFGNNMKYNQEVIDYLRGFWWIHSDITDQYIFEHSKDSFLYQKLVLNLQLQDLKKEIKKALIEDIKTLDKIIKMF